jgi:hypothetical protein
LLEQLQNFKAASYFSSTKEVQILNKIWAFQELSERGLQVF